MFALNSDILNRGPHGPRRKERRGTDRRNRTRLRELCDEVLASYRVARGEDAVSPEDRKAAAELLRGVAPVSRG